MSTLAPPRVEPVPDDRVHISRVPYLPGLDGMRALAVVAVMVYHANSDWLPGGFFGVEMFFVISGYLITLLLISERERTYRISLRHFWLRRARRLLPALFTMMFFVTVWTAIFKNEALGALRGDVIAGFFYVSNWYQIWEGLGYTAAGDFAPLRHLWSLAVEEQFYLLWPVVMIFLLGRNGTRQVAAVSRWLFVCAVLITVATALLFYSGPIAEPNVTPDAYWWLGDRPINKIDTLYLGTVSRAQRHPARRSVRDGLASAGDRPRPTALQGPALRRGGAGRSRRLRLALLEHLPGDAERCRSASCSAAGSSSPACATLSIIAAVTHRGAIRESPAREPGVPVDRHPLVRAVPLPLADLPDDPRRRGQQADGVRVRVRVVPHHDRHRAVVPLRGDPDPPGQVLGAGGDGSSAVRDAVPSWWPRPRWRMAAVVGLVVGSLLLTAPLEQNEIARSARRG